MSDITNAASGDFLDVEGLYQAMEDARSECWENAQALGHMGRVLHAAISVTPVIDPKTGQMVVGRPSKSVAAQVRGYLNRAAHMQSSCAAQCASAWVVFERGLLAPAHAAANTKQPQRTGGMRGMPQPAVRT